MEISEHEKLLNELEEKIDRLRGLYEQYFMGIERLEPLIPRKDVDRRIVQFRKEPPRNTALRFRLNTLAQRFNTMQQHWGRVVREIENGTYRRDVARAAARFGVDEALTAVGRKRAKGLQKVLEAQKEGEARKEIERRKTAQVQEAASAPAPMLDDDDDAPTPPPLQRPGMQSPSQSPSAGRGHDAARFAAPMGGEPAVTADSHRFTASTPQSGPPGGSATTGPSPSMAHSGGAAGASGPPPEAAKKAPAGLRLGGGVRRAADPDAARQRLLELAEKMGAPMPEQSSPAPQAPAPAGPPPARARRFDPDEIMALGVPASAPAPLADRPPSADRPSSSPAISMPPPSANRPLGLRPPSASRASSPALDPLPAAQAPSAPAPSYAPPSLAPARAPIPPAAPRGDATDGGGPSAADRAATRRAELAAQPDRRDGLAEPRVREIYKEFVEAKRRGNESTASITYDKLADSLRQQVDKLKKTHTDRSIDFAIVTKDGKTMIKPIIK